MSITLHVLTEKLIRFACALHTKALVRHRNVLNARLQRSAQHLNNLYAARVQANASFGLAQKALSEHDEVIHAGLDVTIKAYNK